MYVETSSARRLTTAMVAQLFGLTGKQRARFIEILAREQPVPSSIEFGRRFIDARYVPELREMLVQRGWNVPAVADDNETATTGT